MKWSRCDYLLKEGTKVICPGYYDNYWVLF